MDRFITACTFLCCGNFTTCFLSYQNLVWVGLIWYRVSSSLVCKIPPVAILAIFKGRHMSDCSRCTQPPCLAIVVASVSNGSGEPASGPGLARKNGSVQFQNRPEIWPTESWRAKPGPVPINPHVLPGLAGPVSSNVRFCISGFSISGRIQISYCQLHNIDSGISLTIWVVLTAFILKNRRDTLPAQF